MPEGSEAPTLRTGESGALYMALNGVPYGPVGAAGQVTSNLPLSADTIAASYSVADLAQDSDLADYVAVASAQGVSPSALPAGAVLPGVVPAAAVSATTATDAPVLND